MTTNVLAPFPVLVRHTLRSCRPRHRALLLLPGLGALLLAAVSRGADTAAMEGFVQIVGIGVNTLLLPITCLVVGDAILGAEIRSGTFAFTWLSPVRYPVIVLGRWFAGLLLVAAMLGPALIVAALIAGAPDAALPAAASAVAGTGAYLALFMAIGSSLQRAVVWSLAFVLIVERFLGMALSGIAGLSPSWLTQNMLMGVLSDGTPRTGIPAGWAAAGQLGVLTVIALLASSRNVRRLRLISGAD